MLRKLLGIRRYDPESISGKLRKLKLPLNRPARSSDLSQLSVAVGGTLPQEIEALYNDHNGQKPYGLWEYRLMTVKEAVEVANIPELIPVANVRLFWTNDNSDFIGVALSGPLRGLIALTEHDGEPLRLMYRTIESLYSDMMTAYSNSKLSESKNGRVAPIKLPVGLPDDEFRKVVSQAFGWNQSENQVYQPSTSDEPPESLRDFKGDFNHGTSDPLFIEEDRGRAAELWDIFAKAEHDQRSLIVHCLAQLTPRTDSGSLIPLLRDNDFYVAAAAAESLGIRQTPEALELIINLALTGVSNAQTAAWGALCSFPGQRTLNMAVDALHDPSFANWAPHPFLNLLVANGCEVRFSRTSNGWQNIRYRLPETMDWQEVR